MLPSRHVPPFRQTMEPVPTFFFCFAMVISNTFWARYTRLIAVTVWWVATFSTSRTAGVIKATDSFWIRTAGVVAT